MSDRHMSIMEWLGFRKHSGERREEKEIRFNRKTRRELRQDRRGKGMHTFDSTEELMRWLES